MLFPQVNEGHVFGDDRRIIIVLDNWNKDAPYQPDSCVGRSTENPASKFLCEGQEGERDVGGGVWQNCSLNMI